MKDKQFKERYWIRCLIGFNLVDLEQHDNIEIALKQFQLMKNYIIENKKNNAPCLLFLVDSKTDQIIEKYEEIPTEDIKN